MKLAIMQPYLFPYLGYFQLIDSVDIFVAFDDVNYFKKGFINKNNILLGHHKHPFTFPIHQASQNKLINQHTYLKNDDFLKTLHHAYSNAPYYSLISFVISDWLTELPGENVAEFNYKTIKWICNYLGIKSQIIKASELLINKGLKGSERIISICKCLEVATYVNAPGGKNLYNQTEFKQNKLNLKFINPKLEPYQQLSSNFIPNLSIIDMLMMLPPDEIKKHIANYIISES